MSLNLAVLAAGIGSRYGGLKQMDPVGPSGEFIVDYAVFDALRAGFDRVVFVISRQIEKDFRTAIGARIERHLDVEYVFQDLDDAPAGFAVPAGRKKPWGTGHAVRACRKVITTPFAAINSDDFYGGKSYAILAEYLRNLPVSGRSYCMVGFVLGNTLSEHGHVARGVCGVTRGGLLKSIVERTKIEKNGSGARMMTGSGDWQDLGGNELVSMNMWGFTPTIFGHIEDEFPIFLAAEGQDPKAEFFMPSVVDKLIRERRAAVKVLRTPESWFGVTYPDDKPLVVGKIQALVKSGVYPEKLWP